MKRLVALLAVLLPLAPPVLGQETPFALFNDCKPVDLYVSLDDDSDGETELTEARIQTAVESRLRSARLYDPDADPYVSVVVQVILGGRFHVGVRFLKRVFDPASGEYGYGTVWVLSTTGTGGDDGGYILQSVSEKIDRFLVEYLRINEEACGS